MIRTLIEVSADDAHKHESDLTSALARLGFEPKESHESILFRRDLFEAIQELLGKQTWEIVEEYRKRKATARP